MPIPQLSKYNKSNQSWRNQKKRSCVPAKNFSAARKTSIRPRKKSLLFSVFSKKKLLKALFVLFLASGFFIFVFLVWVSNQLPHPEHLLERDISQNTKIYDRTGETVLYEIYGNESRTLVPLVDIPDYVKNATIAIEDKDFYKHGGFSTWAIFRAGVKCILTRNCTGASTLTQQFTKNTILYLEKNKYLRKIKEWVLTPKIESKFTKDEILQMYLNEMPYGSNAYGVEAASQRYFGKSVKEINLAEAAILAALIQAPSRYSPFGPNKDILIGRQNYVLDLMVEQGYTTEAKAEAAKQYKLDFKPQSTSIIAPHFVMYIKEILSEKYGEKTVEQGGLKIITTLDLYKQEIAEEVIKKYAEQNEKNYQATNAALISLDPKTGQILAMVGSRDYFNEEIDGQVNLTTSQRQPGSSLKPIIYATAFAKGYTPDTVLYDVVTNFSNDSDKPYEPHNYDSQEHGPVTIRKALAGSLNIPAVKAIYLAGIDNVLNLADDLGYTTLKERDRFGLSLVLGGGEVKLLEHASAYSAFAREGKIRPIASILRIEDKDGKIIEEFKEEKEKKVLDPETARLINDILSDNDARAYVFGENNWLTFASRPVAAKTGTTNDYHDAWTIGYTPSIVTGVWVGNNDNSEMKRGAAGGVVAAPIWHDYMKKVLGDTPIEYFNKPEEIITGKPVLDGETEIGVKIKIDKFSGLLATEFTPPELIEEKIYKQDHSILYYVKKDDPRGDPPPSPENDPQFSLWENAVLEWAKKRGLTPDSPPTGFDNVHKLENRPQFKIIAPAENQTIMEALLTTRIEATAPRGIAKAEYYLDDSLFSVSSNYPFNLEKLIDFLNNGFHNLKVRVCDDVYNCSEKSLEFNLILDETPKKEEVGVQWITPSDGLAVTPLDFPLTIKIAAINPDQIGKIIVYAVSPKNTKFIAVVIGPINNEAPAGDWLKFPAPGTYKLFAEAYGWNGQFAKSKEITINLSDK